MIDPTRLHEIERIVSYKYFGDYELNDEQRKAIDDLLEFAKARPNPSGDADGREAVVDYLWQEMGDAYDCLRVWSAWSVGTMGEDDFRPVRDRVDDIADAILALTGNASTDRAGTERSEVNNDLQTPAPQGGGEALREVVSALEATLARPACEYLRIERKGAQVLLAALKPQTPDVLGEAREAFLDFIANSKFTEEVDGDADPDGGPPIITVDYRIECDGGVLADFCSALGIKADAWNHNIFAAINAAVAEEPATPPGDVLGGEGEGR